MPCLSLSLSLFKFCVSFIFSPWHPWFRTAIRQVWIFGAENGLWNTDWNTAEGQSILGSCKLTVTGSSHMLRHQKSPWCLTWQLSEHWVISHIDSWINYAKAYQPLTQQEGWICRVDLGQIFIHHFCWTKNRCFFSKNISEESVELFPTNFQEEGPASVNKCFAVILRKGPYWKPTWRNLSCDCDGSQFDCTRWQKKWVSMKL